MNSIMLTVILSMIGGVPPKNPPAPPAVKHEQSQAQAQKTKTEPNRLLPASDVNQRRQERKMLIAG